MTLAEFLLARIAEEEAAAHDWQVEEAPSDCWDSERVLDECDAKRRIVELHAAYDIPQKMVYGTIVACNECGSVDDSPVEWPCPTLRLLALPFADHTDYRDEWKP